MYCLQDCLQYCQSGHVHSSHYSHHADSSTRNHTTYITFQWKSIHFHNIFLQFPIPRIFLRIKNPNKIRALEHLFQHVFPSFLRWKNHWKNSPPTPSASEPGVRSIRALLSASLRCGVCVVLSCIRRGEGEETSTRGLGLNGAGSPWHPRRWQLLGCPVGS